MSGTVRGADAPSARFRRPTWRDPRLLTGLLLVLLSVAGVTAVVTATNRTDPYLAAARDIEVGQDVTGQAEVLDAIDHERRVELAFEGDRWPDLVRTGRATTVLDIPATFMLWPVPQGERDVASGLTQNPGY